MSDLPTSSLVTQPAALWIDIPSMPAPAKQPLWLVAMRWVLVFPVGLVAFNSISLFIRHVDATPDDDVFTRWFASIFANLLAAAMSLALAMKIAPSRKTAVAVIGVAIHIFGLGFVSLVMLMPHKGYQIFFNQVAALVGACVGMVLVRDEQA